MQKQTSAQCEGGYPPHLARVCKMATHRYELPEDADEQAAASQTTQETCIWFSFVCDARLLLPLLSPSPVWHVLFSVFPVQHTPKVTQTGAGVNTPST